MELSSEYVRGPFHLLHCMGQLAMWAIQDVLICVDDNIQDLPDA